MGENRTSMHASRWPNHLKEAVEDRTCRGCGAWKGKACFDPRKFAVYVTVYFEDGVREFCYERVYDYFESHRPEAAEASAR